MVTTSTSEPSPSQALAGSAFWPDHVRKPNFFIVGAPRCGTTALYTYLREHADIFMPQLKEPDFFADFLGKRRRIRTWEEYRACFSGACKEKRIGEASVSYLASRTSAEDLRRFSPDASILIMLRNPLDVMQSMYYLRRLSNLEDLPTFEAALQADANGRLVVELPYRERVRFAEQVERYFWAFGREKVHVIVYDDFKKDPLRVYQGVLRFLDVNVDSRQDFPVINRNRRARNRAVWTMLRRPPMFVRRMVCPVTSRELRKSIGSFLLRLNTIYEPRPEIAPNIRRLLQADLAPEIRRLSTLLERDLTFWCDA